MKNKGFLLILFFLTTILTSYSQYEVLIDAFILDQNTNKPIPYINVGFIDKGVGTVSDINGQFYLRYDEEEINHSDVVQFSGIGYKPVQYTYKKLFEILNQNNKILLAPSEINLDATTVLFEESKIDAIGYINYDSNLLAYWRDKNALGSQIGGFIKSSRKNSKLLNLKFDVVENASDSLLVRVNIYKNDNGKPGTNIVTDNIYHTISRKTGEEIIDLSAYNIVVDEDFIASIELIKVYGKNIKFAITGSRIGHSFIKSVSHDNWKLRKDAGVAFKIQTLVPLSSYGSNEHEKPKNITLYWDTSLSMKEKNIDKEIKFLEEYFSKIINIKVNLVTFSNSAAKAKTFVIENGSNVDLIDEIKKIRYNGATNFSTLFKEKDAPDQYLVFTDGNYNYGKPEFVYHVPVFYISSKINSNHKELQQSAHFTNGLYLNLIKTDPLEALSYVFNKDENPLMYNEGDLPELIQGVVLSEDTPVQGCRILVKGTLIQSETNADGVFYVNAKEGDVLEFEHFGFEDKEVLLHVAKEIKIDLKPKYNKLSQVRVGDKEGNNKNEVLDIGGIKKDKRKVGFAAYTLNKDKFPPSAVYLSDLIRTRFPAVSVKGYGDRVIYRSRGISSLVLDSTPLFVVDGIPTDAPPTHIVPMMIDNITYVPGIAGSVRYGRLARNGVFYIKTVVFANATKIQDQGTDEFIELGSNYVEPKLTLDALDNQPDYLDELWESNTYKEALEQYFELRKYHEQEASFYIYCFEYFKKWNKDFSKQVLSNLVEISNNNDYEMLRALAFRLEELGDKESALLVYESIFEIKPDYAQSYLDLARIYKENQRYQDAFEIYKIMLQNKEQNIDFKPLLSQVKSQIRHLLNNHRVEVSYSDVPTKLLVVKSAPVRIVFDWNDPDAEFILQFVNPKKKYYEWSNQSDENKESFIEETNNGTLSKEFVIDTSFEGEWMVNLHANNKPSQLPPAFLKYTIYTNYGLPNETKTVKFIKLYNHEEKVMLDRFSI